MRQHQLKMNPTKSFLGVASGKFLGFVIKSKRISLDPEKVKAIQDMPPPRSLRELRGLQGRLAYIRKFIANLSGKCQPFSKLMKKWGLLCLGSAVPGGIRPNQALPHLSTGARRASCREALSTICPLNGP